MTLRRKRITLSIERELPGPGGATERIGISAELEPGTADAAEPGPEAYREALEQMRRDLVIAIGRSAEPGAEPRSLEELVETYRPRQGELVDLLVAEGEISEVEADRLRSYLSQGEPTPVFRPAGGTPIPPPIDRPLAAMPLENDRTPASARPLRQLLDDYRIETLKQAGAVRARRQISYEEYMALKRHFAAAESAAAAPKSPPPAPPAPPEGPA